MSCSTSTTVSPAARLQESINNAPPTEDEGIYSPKADRWPPNGRRTPTLRVIMEYVRDRVAPYLRVRRVEFSELAKTISGKIRRVELRRREDAAHFAGTPITTEYRYEDLVG